MSSVENNDKTSSIASKIGTILIFLATFILVLSIGAFVSLLIIFKGPSPKTSQVYVLKMTESGHRNIVRIYLSDEEIDNIIAGNTK